MEQLALEHIIKESLSGSRKCQEELYQYCSAHLLKISFRYFKNKEEAAEAFNLAMHKVFANLQQFKGDGPFLGWVGKIIVHTCLSTLKQKSRFLHKDLDTVPAEVSIEASVYQKLGTQEILGLVQELPENLRLVFNLFVVEGYGHEQIAEELTISKGTSKWYLHEARNQLKEKIKALTYHETRSNAI